LTILLSGETLWQSHSKEGYTHGKRNEGSEVCMQPVQGGGQSGIFRERADVAGDFLSQVPCRYEACYGGDSADANGDVSLPDGQEVGCAAGCTGWGVYLREVWVQLGVEVGDSGAVCEVQESVLGQTEEGG
jgi:hypothetical protein